MAKKARARLVGFALVTFASALCVQSACLPDAVLFTADGGPDAIARDSAPPRACGNGAIDLVFDEAGALDLDASEQCDPGATEAGVIGCTSDCRIECDTEAGIDPVTHHCYFASDAQTSENASVNACGNANAHVVTFASDDEIAFVQNGLGASSYWVGLAYDPGISGYASAAFILGLGGACEPGYTASCPGCFAKIADAGSPGFPGVSEQCVTANDSGVWSGTACVDASATLTICEREPVGSRSSAQNGAFLITVAKTQSQKKYLYIPTQTPPDIAGTTCTQLGGSLVTFDSREEREELVHEILLIRGSTTGIDFDFWIGLAELPDGGFGWDQEDAGATPPLPWGPGEPVASAPGARAYVFIAPSTGSADDQGLARTDDQTMHGFVCQLPLIPGDGGVN